MLDNWYYSYLLWIHKITDMNIRYRADVDGLRALAVLLVFAYHLKISVFSGGFVGVDVFFVISGFLITGIVIRALDENKFSFLDFFNRRIKRIVPNVLIVATCSVIAGWFLLLPNDYASLISSYFYTSIYAANFYFWDATGAYFASASDEMPLLHMWSLAVEEQFYFVWPVILFFAFKYFRGKHLGLMALALAVVSFGISEHIAIDDAGLAYYMLHTRSGGLLLGAALALMHRDYKPAREFNSWIIVLLGTILIIWSSLTIDPTTVFPGINSAIPSFGAFLVIAGGSGFKYNYISKIYSAKPIVWIGLISFSVYLWHWPFIAFATYLDIIDSYSVKALIFAVTIILSFASLKLVENPIRKSRLNFRQSFFRINLVFIVVSLLAVYASSSTKGFEGRFNDKALNVGKLDVKYAGIDEGWCHVSAEGISGIAFKPEMANCYIGDKTATKEALYIGDSNAGHYGPFVDEMARRAGFKVRQLSTSSCYPTREIKEAGENPEVCENFRRIIDEEITSKKYDTIIIANRWARDDRHMSFKKTDFKQMLAFYASHAKHVIVMDQMPEWWVNPATCFERGTCDMKTEFKLAPGMDESRKKIADAVAAYPNIDLVDPYYLIEKDGVYTPFAMGYPMYHDTGHLSIRGMKWVAYMYFKDHHNPLK
ncbi:acyltransferase family protein [Enterobacter hormaechei]|uniref:acyltransferase family protein n=1 Tax=Enterobacter hormaechei TaxID=158836 RepID=UPI0039C4B47C